MVEGAELKGVARTAATGAAGLSALGAVLSVVALVLPWWTGTSSVGLLASKRTVQSDITLWSFELTLGTQVSDGAGGTTMMTERSEMTWDQMCSLGAETADGEPGVCGNVRAIRACSILAPLFGLPGALASLQSRTVSPLLLVAGALLGALEGIFSTLSIVMGILVSTSGLSGLGVVCALGAAILSFVGVSAALYGAGVAMPVDVPPPPKRLTRRDRVKEQLARDAELKGELEARNPKDASPGFLEAPSDESVESRKAPVMLRRVLFWNQEHAGESDAEGIPTELLEMAFREIDGDGSGSIDIEELVENLALCGLNASIEATQNIMKDIDKDCSGDIDIHEFVGFFRELEELDRFQAKTQQRAQFAQCLCNVCFIAHIIIVSVLLMEFINMEEADDPDSYLIYQNMLLAFSVALAILLVSVICLPAIRLTMGGNLSAWQRQYNEEVASRLKRKPASDEGEPQGPRQAAWVTSASTAEGLTQLTVNSAMFGSSYRPTKQVYIAEQAQLEATRLPGASRSQSRAESRAQSRAASKVPNASRRPGVVATSGNSFERYDPESYRAAARASFQQRAPASFSPMQVRDMDLPREPEVPSLALETSPPGVLTGTGFYHREL